ncbi:hypothetical protein ABIC63_002102 [Pseudacidovorax sp. 1753]|uniref:metal-dependent phosphohydrolase n=1 Tax=Pseudacidovorax sp. 1753 TaxID=3156419 RepID=UPI003393FE62
MTVKHLKGPTIMLASGRYFDLEDPAACDFDIGDIAHALAHICRFTGHCSEFYSVAQHSVMVSVIVPREHALAGLLHDAAEAFIGDVSKPLKMLLPDYKAVEQRIEAAVFARFGLPPKLPACVKEADVRLLRTEQRDLMDAEGHAWSFTEGVAPLPLKIAPQSPKVARMLFINRFNDLQRGAGGVAC